MCVCVFSFSLGLADRFEEYPKLRELIRLKDELISTTNTPPMQVSKINFNITPQMFHLVWYIASTSD